MRRTSVKLKECNRWLSLAKAALFLRLEERIKKEEILEDGRKKGALRGCK